MLMKMKLGLESSFFLFGDIKKKFNLKLDISKIKKIDFLDKNGILVMLDNGDIYILTIDKLIINEKKITCDYKEKLINFFFTKYVIYFYFTNNKVRLIERQNYNNKKDFNNMKEIKDINGNIKDMTTNCHDIRMLFFLTDTGVYRHYQIRLDEINSCDILISKRNDISNMKIISAQHFPEDSIIIVSNFGEIYRYSTEFDTFLFQVEEKKYIFDSFFMKNSNGHIFKVINDEYITFFLTNKGVYVYGYNINGLLGINNSNHSYITNITKIEFFEKKNIIDIVIGKTYAFALSSNGKVYKWGKIGKDDFLYTPTEMFDL